MKIKPTSEKAKSASKVSSRSHLGERVPRLRFPGFGGEWKFVPFGSIIRETNLRTNIENEDILLSAAIEGMFLNSELFDHQRGASNKGYKKIKLRTLVLSTQNLHLGNANVNLRFEHGIVSPAYKTYEVVGCDPVLLGQWVKTGKAKKFFFDATTVGASVCRRNVEWDTLYQQQLCLPTENEQHKLADFLSLLTDRISSQQRLVELLKKHKRGVIEQIFGRRLDMGKDAEKWDIVELRDLFSKVARRNRDGKVKNVITNSAEFGLIPQRDFFDKSIAVDGNTDGYYVIRTGDFVYNPRKSTAAPFGPFNRYMGKEDGIISPLYTCLVPKGKANAEYLAWYFRSTAWNRYVYDNGSQGARHDRVNMTDDLLFGIPVLLPPIAVQERIANGLNAIDARWSSANKVLAHLEKMKRGLLQQLFA